MDREQVWQVIEDERRSLADLLEELTEDEWEYLSLAEGWRVRDVVAHLTLSTVPTGTVVRELARAGGNVHRMIRDTAIRKAAAPVDQLVDELRALSPSRAHPVGTTHLEPLIDILVHGQDVVLPLERELPMPLEAASVAADRVWSTRFPFHARRRLHGFRLEATDVSWAGGRGAIVSGPISAVLLLLTGRSAALSQVDGPGVAALSARLGTGPTWQG